MKIIVSLLFCRYSWWLQVSRAEVEAVGGKILCNEDWARWFSTERQASSELRISDFRNLEESQEPGGAVASEGSPCNGNSTVPQGGGRSHSVCDNYEGTLWGGALTTSCVTLGVITTTVDWRTAPSCCICCQSFSSGSGCRAKDWRVWGGWMRIHMLKQTRGRRNRQLYPQLCGYPGRWLSLALDWWPKIGD